jgi:translocation and assembly module TamB
VVLLGAAYFWLVPVFLVRQLEAQYGGHVAIGGWWAAPGSAGVRDLVLHEGPGADSPVWARAEAVTTDLTLAGLLTGRVTPRRITLTRPSVTIRLDRDGDAETTIPEGAAGSGGPSAIPEVLVEDATLTFAQEGRDPMVVRHLGGRLTPVADGVALDARADDPTWGRLEGQGRFAGDLGSGTLRLWSDSIVADPDKARRLPFVPEATWDHLLPTGPLGVVLTIDLPEGSTRPLRVETAVTFQGTALDLPTLGIEATRATGRLTFSDGVVRVEGAKGQAVGGTVEADGTLDFDRSPPRIDLNLGLQGVDIARAPRRWQLQDAGLTGDLSGRVRLVVDLTDRGADLTGSSGVATVTGGTIEDIPAKSFTLRMSGEGGSIRYDAGGAATTGFRGWLARQVVAIQAPGQGDGGGLILPKTLTTDVEFEDVDLTQVLSKADALGLHLPFVVAGNLSLRARATIPLGALRDVKSYAFHGEATLKGANLAGVDIGHAVARLDLEDGVLELSDFRGRLVERPSGGLADLPEPTDPVPKEGPLPPGGFRGRLLAQVAPLGPLTAHFEANALPLAELAAPAFPRPTPVSGEADVAADLAGDLARAGDPAAWAFDARLAGRGLTYRGATLDDLAATVGVRESRLEVRGLSARLGGRPLEAGGSVGLAAPHPFEARLSVEGWDLGGLLALIPAVPTPAPVSGRLTAHANAQGTLAPLRLTSRGEGRLGDLVAGPVAVGDVPVRWATEGSAIDVEVAEARPLGGTLSARARVPGDGGPIAGSAEFRGIDAARLAGALPGEPLRLSGLADGRVRFTIRPGAPEGEVPVEASVRLEAPDLSVQGIPARSVEAALTVRRGTLEYDLSAESLGGRVKLKGDVPLGAAPAPAPGASAVEVEASQGNGRVEAINFAIREDLWGALGVTGALARLRGRGAVVANVRFDPSAGLAGLRSRGLAEFRDLAWGPGYPLGRLHGTFARAPQGWSLDPLSGELFGGEASGWVRSGSLAPEGVGEADPAEGLRFALSIDRLALERLAAIAPAPAGTVRGVGSLRVSGRMGEALRATGDLRVPAGRLAGLPLADLHAPVELVYVPGSDLGTVEARRWTARLAGGRVQGSTHARFGLSRAFQAELGLTDLELEYLSRAYSGDAHPARGKVSGVIRLAGLDALRPETYRGRADLVLGDAAVLDLPVFRALDRFLGGPEGGIFEQGELRAAIGNGRVEVEELNLQGRVAQLHASGTVGFDGGLDLIVLINTNQIIAETGQALVALIPGLRDGRGGSATLQVSSFLSNRLLKLRVRGTLRSPTVSVDPAVTVSNAAVGFFAGALKLPLGLLR